MLSQVIWWGSLTLEALLLVRGYRGRLLSRYFIFYAYLIFVLLQSLLRNFVYHAEYQLYPATYWATELLGIIIGCGIVFEIYRVGLSAFPGTARMARRVLAILFVLASVMTLASIVSDSQWWTEMKTLQIDGALAVHLEGALRAVQAFAILGLVTLFLFYAIPFGKNLRGMLLGYGLFVGARVVCLAFALPARGHDFWFFAYSASYPIVLSIWVAHLWSYKPEPRTAARLERDYQRIAAATRLRLDAARGHIAKAVRP